MKLFILSALLIALVGAQSSSNSCLDNIGPIVNTTIEEAKAELRELMDDNDILRELDAIFDDMAQSVMETTEKLRTQPPLAALATLATFSETFTKSVLDTVLDVTRSALVLNAGTASLILNLFTRTASRLIAALSACFIQG